MMPENGGADLTDLANGRLWDNISSKPNTASFQSHQAASMISQPLQQSQQPFDMIDRILKRGKMVRILRGTFVKGQFVVDHVYKGIRAELVRKKDEIMKQKPELLFDYYEKVLGMRGSLIIRNQQTN